jgi:hypothetical protein
MSITERNAIGRMLRLIAVDTCNDLHRDFLVELAVYLEGEHHMTQTEAKMVDWLLNYATQAGQQVQTLNQQLSQIQSDNAAAQPTVDRLTALYNANQSQPAAIPTPLPSDATPVTPPQA